jgi:hypothetical protein
MAKFKSYASPSGFRPLEAPDESNKYLQQGQQALRSMQRAMEFDLSNRDRYARATQNAQQMEMANRDMIFQQDTRNRQAVQQQVQNNYAQTIRDAERQGQDEVRTLQALSSFSETAFKALGEFNQKREEGIKLGVQQAMLKVGLDTKSLMEIHKLDRNLTDQALSENQFIKGLLDKGNGSIQDIRYLMKHSNAKYWSESRSLAENIGVGYGNFVNQNYETKFKVREGEEISYAEARANGDQEAQQTILSQLQSQYLRESGALNLSPQAAAAYIHPQMRAFENQLQQASNAEYRKLADTEVQNNITRSIHQKISTEGAAGAAQWLSSLPSGNQRREGKQALLRYFATAASGDGWQDAQKVWQDLLNQPIDEQGTTFGEFNKNDSQVIGVSREFIQARARSLQDFNLQETETRTGFELAARELAQMLKDNPNGFTEADGEAAQLRLQELFKGRVAPGTRSDIIDNLIKNESTNALYRKNLEEQLQKLADTGQLTKERMEAMGVPGTIAAKWMNMAEATSRDRAANGNFKPQMEALASLAKSPPTIQAKPDGTYHWSVPLMTQRLQNRFLTKYAELKAAGDPNAVNAALSFVQQEFAAQAKNPRFFSQDATNLGGYAAFTQAAKPSGVAVARMKSVQTSIAKLGVKALDSPGAIFNKAQLVQLEQDMAKPRFTMDPMAQYVGTQMGVDPFTVINRQRRAAGLKPIGLPQAAVTFSTTVNPELKRKLDAYRTPELSARAMASTRTFDPNIVPKGYGPLVVEAAQKAGINPAFVAAFAEAENGSWDPNILSMGGAAAGVGLMQLSQEYHGPGATRAERERALKDPRLNLTLGAGILSGIYKKYGNWKDTVYVWNMGETGYANWVAAGRPNTAQAGYAKNLYERFEKARAKYGDVSALRSAGTMRQSMQRYGATSFERPSSVTFEKPGDQPGVDLYFESKRFPALLGGVVKDVSREPRYGNYVVIESTDPLTGQKVDVLYAHFADGVAVRPGQQINAGDIIGIQGGTGNVRSVDGTIASIDFLAPAARGSKSMKPYAGFDKLRRHLVQQLQR